MAARCPNRVPESPLSGRSQWLCPPCSRHCQAPAKQRRRRGPARCSGPQDEQAKQNAASGSNGPQPKLNDPVQTIAWGGRLPNRRRFVLSTLTGLGVVLVSNLGNTTGFLLGLLPRTFARTLRLDVLYPVKGFKRCLDLQNGFEFLYPARWLADQRLLQRYATRVEQQNALDPPSIAKAKQKKVAEPAAAFGPAGSTGEQNLSVIVAPVSGNFELRSLGSPQDAAQRFLETTIAPRSSDIEAKLISASQRTEADELYYIMEYTVQRPSFFRHNLSVYAVRNGLLYTLNAQVPNQQWSQSEVLLRQAAASFRVLDAGAGALDYPQRLQ